MQALENSIYLCNRLLEQLNTYSVQFGTCINGDVLIEYRKGNEKAQNLAKELRAQLQLLQQEQAANLRAL